MNIENGVSGYIAGTTTVTSFFPIDLRGNPHVYCRQCRYFNRYQHTCGLNGAVCEFPDTNIGSHCPFDFTKEENYDGSEF